MKPLNPEYLIIYMHFTLHNCITGLSEKSGLQMSRIMVKNAFYYVTWRTKYPNYGF